MKMATVPSSLLQLKAELEEVQLSLAKLKQKESLLQAKISAYNPSDNVSESNETCQYTLPQGLNSNDISRYSRQLLLPQIGALGQAKIKAAKVLVVGAGGLGSSALLYLAAMGVGNLGIVDFDCVDNSNLHRQIIHNEARQGLHKAISAKQSINLLNSQIKVSPILEQLTSDNALHIFKNYDIIVDATDNLPSRYLISDAAVLAAKPLVYGSALRLDGQIVVYNYRNGPCYRCLFPTPPKFDPTQNCSEAGVLGVVPGIIGCLQALQVIKIILGEQLHPFCNSSNSILDQKYYMTTFSAFGAPQFKHIRIRGRQPHCKICSSNPEINRLIDYPAFCGATQSDAPVMLSILNKNDAFRLSCLQYKQVRSSNSNHLLLDVRDTAQFVLCSLKNSIHIPYPHLLNLLSSEKSLDHSSSDFYPAFNHLISQISDPELPVYIICRRGNLSQLAVSSLRHHGYNNCYQIDGGLTSWQNDVDPSFPSY
ncbi:hypothetical protein BB561_000355 [Smittium simulii]|uniref:Rhodanese domain-containing protein n=1 Tax=Smittium simulii TaxID=133385 RepID=A0A2T9YZH6_9FUNG|nr:hypothetical protein BB561_000355 [Smittium simulii]